MSDKTGISWTDATWGVVRGCRRTAPSDSKQSGCGDPSGGGCYAEKMAYRFAGPGLPYEGLVKLGKNGPRWTGKVRFVSERLMDPLRWKKPRRIFTDSMSDLFYEGVEDWMIDRVVAVMMISSLHERRGGHIFQTLTKRPKRMRAYFADPTTRDRVARVAGTLMEDGDGWYDVIASRKEGLVHPNLWWGVSVENQAAADERIPELLHTPAAVRFLSCEPLLGPIDLTYHLADWVCRTGGRWIIAGCESGPGARPCDVAWLRSLRDQCAAVDDGFAFFLKQARGELVDTYRPMNNAKPSHTRSGAKFIVSGGPGSKKKGGGIFELPYLDGVQHKAFPEVPGGA